MNEKVKGIVLNKVRHSDRVNIVGVYTPGMGRVSLVMNVGTGAGARKTAALLMPLAQVEFECATGTGKELLRPRGIAFSHTYKTVYFSPVKSSLMFFLAEFLSRILRQSEGDVLLFRYITESLQALDLLPAASTANFHITFLSGLATFMGIAPDIEGYKEGCLFDMRAGAYSMMHPGHNDVLIGEAARMPLLLNRLNYANMSHLKMHRCERAAMLDGILRYWSIHYPGLSGMKSTEILAELFF
ncbi:MAG: DNA repair protein RecO [Prevotella sp.]|nr:DNA repair protein RecO [Prevotella sp.]MCM1075037.1 DNA repair protein RecO [Ruminococcus sp.]